VEHCEGKEAQYTGEGPDTGQPIAGADCVAVLYWHCVFWALQFLCLPMRLSANMFITNAITTSGAEEDDRRSSYARVDTGTCDLPDCLSAGQ